MNVSRCGKVLLLERPSSGDPVPVRQDSEVWIWNENAFDAAAEPFV
jgi:hypothetical protein